MVVLGTPVWPAYGDVPDSDTLITGWEGDLISRFSASQVGFQNWAGGGANTLSLALGLDGALEQASESWEQSHQLRVNFGMVKQDTLEFRKAEDEIRLGSAFQYHGKGFFRTFNPTLEVTVRTQLAPGFNYKRNPLKNGRKPPVKVSGFFAPATFTQAAGMTYGPGTWFTQRVGIGSKQTVVSIRRLRQLYSLRPGQLTHFELGVEAKTKLDRKVAENVRYKSLLSLFTSFNQTSSLPDLSWENLLVMKVNKWLGVNLEVVTRYDKDVSKALQMKEVFSLGVSFSLI